MNLTIDKPIPSMLTVAQTAEILFGSAEVGNQKRVRKLIAGKVLRCGRRPKNTSRTTIFIKATSVRDYVS